MRRFGFSLGSACLVVASLGAFAAAAPDSSGLPPAATKHWTADNGNGTYSNPLFYEEFEDPDVIRVGDDYYLAGTTMHMNPAVQLMRSKDLVNWELTGYCMDRLDLGPDFRLEREDLTPSDTAGLDPRLTLGFITAQGGLTSHSDILARTLGLPAIVGMGAGLLENVAAGTLTVLDGRTGEMIISPEKKTIARFESTRARLGLQLQILKAASGKDAQTANGRRVEVAANIGERSGAREALEYGTEGIGLLRTEFLYLEDAQPAPEEKQYLIYRGIFEVMSGRPVIVLDRVELELQGALADAAARGDAGAAKTLAAWRTAWRLPAGSVFTNNAWRDAKLAELAQLRSAGYATAAWHSTEAQVDADSAKVSIAVVDDSGPLFRTGALVVQGLQRQDEINVRNLAGFEPGTPATEVLLLDYQERLQRAGLFERATVTLATDPAQADAATVTVAVAEMPLQQASPGIGISANDGLRVSAEHTHRRAFGFPATMHNKLEFSKKRRAWEGELSTHTLPCLYRNQLGGAAEQLDSDTDRVISLSFRVGRAYETQRAERLTFVEVERGLVRGVCPPRIWATCSRRSFPPTLCRHWQIPRRASCRSGPCFR